MTRDDIIKLAREAGLMVGVIGCTVESCRRFADCIAAAEREACADILDRNADRCDPYSVAFDVLDSNAKAIRSRSQK